jgi:nicotinamide-nucleotide amidase
VEQLVVADEPAAPADVVRALIGLGRTLATGESLTAGLVSATLADVPGCSAVLRGGIVAYQADVKAGVLGVSAAALSEGVVSAAVAVEMARGAAALLHADVGIGTTGVAGPGAHDAVPAGTVWIAVVSGDRVGARLLELPGDRAAVRHATVAQCWPLVLEVLAEE